MSDVEGVKRQRKGRWNNIQIQSTSNRWDLCPSTTNITPECSTTTLSSSLSSSSSITKPTEQTLDTTPPPPPPPPAATTTIATATPSIIPPNLRTELVNDLLQLPNGPVIIRQNLQHLLPITSSYLDSVLLPGFISVKPPKDYVPPTRNQLNLLQSGGDIASTGTSGNTTTLAGSTTTTTTTGGSEGTIASIKNPIAGNVEFQDILEIDPGIQKRLGEISLSRDDYKIFNTLLYKPLTLSKNDQDIQILLLQIKHTTGRQRKGLSRILIRDGGVQYPPASVLPPLLQMLRLGIQNRNISHMQRHILFNIIMRLTPYYGQACLPHVNDLLRLAQSLLLDEDAYIRDQGGSYIGILTRTLGSSPIITSIQKDVLSPEETVRETAARTLAYISQTLGANAILPFITILLKSKKTLVVETGLRTVQKMARLLGNVMIENMESLIINIYTILESAQTNNILIAVLRCISQLCIACKPYLCPSFYQIIDILTTLAPKCKNRAHVALVECIAAYLGSLPTDIAIQHWELVSPQVLECCLLGDSRSLTIGISAITAAIRADSIPVEGICEHLLPFLKEHLFTAAHFSEARNIVAIKELVVTIAGRIGGATLFDMLIPHLNDLLSRQKNVGLDFSFAVALLITDVLVQIGSNSLSTERAGELAVILCNLMVTELTAREVHTEKALDSSDNGHIPSYVLNRIFAQGMWTTHPIIRACGSFFEALGPKRMIQHRAPFIALFTSCHTRSNPHLRYQAWALISYLVQYFDDDEPLTTTNTSSLATQNAPPSSQHTSAYYLALFWNKLFEATSEPEPVVLASSLCALRNVILAMQRLQIFLPITRGELEEDDQVEDPNEEILGPEWKQYSMPSPSDFFLKITPMLQNSNEFMVLGVTRLLDSMGTTWGTLFSPVEWQSIVTQYVSTILLSSHRCIRKSVVRLVGVCAQCGDPTGVIVHLLKLLGNDNRTVRVGVTSCIGYVAQTCGIYVVLPLIFHAYEFATLKTISGVLNCIVVCVQHSSKSIGFLPTALFPFLTHFLSHPDHKIIRKGLTIASGLIIQAMVHNYSETGKSLAETVGSYIAPLRATNSHTYGWWWHWRLIHAALASGLGFHYARALYVGLFHPAKRVRDTHWTWYNHVLLQKQHQVPMHMIKMTQSGISPVNTTSAKEMINAYKLSLAKQKQEIHLKKQSNSENDKKKHEEQHHMDDDVNNDNNDDNDDDGNNSDADDDIVDVNAEKKKTSEGTSETVPPIITLPQCTEYNDPYICHALSLPF